MYKSATKYSDYGDLSLGLLLQWSILFQIVYWHPYPYALNRDSKNLYFQSSELDISLIPKLLHVDVLWS